MELTTKTRFGLASDLHLDFGPMNPEFFDWRGDILLLAGDLAEEDRLRKMVPFWEGVSKMAKEVYVIAGNHEFYRSEIDTAVGHMKEFLEAYPNIRYLDDETVVTHDVAIFGSTLWADFEKGNPMVMWDARTQMNDYRHIRVKRDGYRKLTPDQTLSRHRRALMALENSLKEHSDLPFVVMTHHAPSFQSVRSDYANDPLNGAYASNLEQFIIDNRQIQTWVHGHIHTRCAYDVEGCMVMANTRGYPGERPGNLPPYQPLTFELEI